MNNLGLIIDRTQADVDNRTSKGFYNAYDIARINSAIMYLADKLGFDLVVEDFAVGDLLTKSKMDAIISNVKYIKENYYTSSTAPNVPVLAGWNYAMANDLESLLMIANDFYNSGKTVKLYSGAFRLGSHFKINM